MVRLVELDRREGAVLTRPDARLLVPVASLPGGRAPVGATVWHDGRRGIVCERGHHETFGPSVDVTWSDLMRRKMYAFEVSLDLSRPDVVDGVPARLDALGWALGVLGWKSNHVIAESGGGTHRRSIYIDGNWGVSDGSRITDYADIYDTAGLSDDDASRAVVAAALRGGA